MATVAMIVSNSCNPDPRVEKEARALISAGHEVTIHAFDRDEKHLANEIVEGVLINRYRCGKVPIGAPSIKIGFKVIQGLNRFRKKVIETLENDIPDVVHCHDADTLKVGVHMKKYHSTRLVFDMHDLAHTWVRMAKPKSIVRRFSSWAIERKLVSRLDFCDLIVTSSGAVSKTSHPGFREWIKKRSNTDVIVVENRPIAKNKITHLPEKFTIGYFGKIREPKMFKILLKAVEKWEQPNQPSIIIAGHGTAEEEVIQMLSNSSIDVEFNGKFTQDELPKLIERISVMYAVYPVTRGNILEGAIPTKMFDAAAEGRPSVVNNKCLMGDIAIAENIGYPISSNNFIELLDTLTAIKEGGIQVKLERDWSGEASRLIEAYKRFVSND